MKMITKAVIPAAGWGTRMLPAAKAVPKELLPILDKPTIQYVVEEAANAGVHDVLLVTQRDKRAIEDHFDRNAELEDRLDASNKQHLLRSVATIMEKVQIHSVRQSRQLGLGHAVLQAKKHVGESPFLCMLGDTIFSGETSPSKQLIEAYLKTGSSVLALEEVPLDRVSRYGIAGGTMIEPGLMKIDSLVEKPSPGAAPSRFAIAARYVLVPSIFTCLEKTRAGKGGEIQLTDALQFLIKSQDVYGVVINSNRHDIGNPADWLLTNIEFATKSPELWSTIEARVRQLLDRA